VEIQVVVPPPTDERVRNLMKELESVSPGDPRRICSRRLESERADGLRSRPYRETAMAVRAKNGLRRAT